jgi:hypothetical protein
LISLDQAEIEAVIGACIAVEAVETAMAIAGKAVGGVAFTVPDGEESRARLTSALRQACSLLDAADALMTPSRVPEMDEARETRFDGASASLRISTEP